VFNDTDKSDNLGNHTVKKRFNSQIKVLSAFAAGAIFTMTAQEGLAEDMVSIAQANADITTMCGDKPTIVALADPFGGSTWNKQVLAELEDEASKCPNITKILYTDASGDAQKANNDINSLVAQGANIIISFPFFGPSQIPAYRSAMRSGAVVIPYNGDPGGEAGRDYSANVYQDTPQNARIWVEWLAEHMGSGRILFFGGPAGNASTAKVYRGLQEALADYPDIELLGDSWIDTQWTPVGAQKAAIGTIAKYGEVDAILADSGFLGLQVIRAYEQAGLKIPFMAMMSGTNEVSCKWQEDKAAGNEWPYLTLEGTTTYVRPALRRGMAMYQGLEDDEPLGFPAYVYVDTLAGLEPECRTDMPIDADLSGRLSEDQLRNVFGN